MNSNFYIEINESQKSKKKTTLQKNNNNIPITKMPMTHRVFPLNIINSEQYSEYVDL
jgi:hypothetical protein